MALIGRVMIVNNKSLDIIYPLKKIRSGFSAGVKKKDNEFVWRKNLDET